MVRLIYGNDFYLANRWFEQAKQNYEEPCVFYIFDEETRNACEQMNLFGMLQQRGVFVRLDSLTKNECLEEYLKDPSDTCDLFVLAGAVQKNLKVYKAFGDNIQVCDRVDEAKLQRYILSFLGKKGAVITDEAYQLFVERIGYLQPDCPTDLGVVFSELERLALLDTQITADLVRREIINQYADAFSLTTLYFKGRYTELLLACDTLAQQKDFNAIQTLSLLLRNWRCGYQKIALGEKVFVKISNEDATPKQLVRELEIITDGIRKVKSGQYNSRNALKLVALQLVATHEA